MVVFHCRMICSLASSDSMRWRTASLASSSPFTLEGYDFDIGLDRLGCYFLNEVIYAFVLCLVGGVLVAQRRECSVIL